MPLGLLSFPSLSACGTAVVNSMLLGAATGYSQTPPRTHLEGALVSEFSELPKHQPLMDGTILIPPLFLLTGRFHLTNNR